MRHMVLFGGGGYVGSHIARWLHDEGCPFTVVDRYPPEDPVARANYVEWDRSRPNQMVVNILARAGNTTYVDFIHLACPRNKPQVWDTKAAVLALHDGLDLAGRLPQGQRVFISSQSVYDLPENRYSVFKTTAEVAALRANFGVIRLGTVLGTAYGCKVYRGDLGLHMIAASLAEGNKAWVNPEVRRHVVDVAYAVTQILKVEAGTVAAATRGVVSFADVVPPVVDRRMVDDNYFVAAEGRPASPENLAVLQATFEALVLRIKGEEVWSI